jgi:feruloyl esterase
MKTAVLALVLVVCAPLAALAQPSGRLKPIYPDAAPVCSPEDLRKVSLPNTTIESVAIDPKEGSCRVLAVVTHPPAHDRVRVWVALPTKGWNGRFRGNGGGGFVAGSPDSLRGPVAEGYATAATDAGHEGGSGSFALAASGRLNWQEIRDFAYLGIHEMTVTGKALAQAFYGKAPRYSYFTGSSTGGRQALMEAQRYPEDYDGILAGCPAIHWARMVPVGMWAQVAMLEGRNFISKAKLDAVTAAVVAACDGDDGVVDGVINDPGHCTWDPKAFVGTKVGAEVFTEADAEVVRKIWAGPPGPDGQPLWYGLSRGASLTSLAGTDGAPLQGKPFGPALDWLRYFLAQNATWDWTTLTRDDLQLFFSQSAEVYGPVFSADDADLSRFRDHGGKVLILHGLADQLIPHPGTIAYYERVQRTMGGAERAAEFARLFLVPGVDHGFRGTGPSPTGQMPALIAWVESGTAPDRLLAETRDKTGHVTRSRPLFPYPQSAHYKGSGSTDDAANFTSAAPPR